MNIKTVSELSLVNSKIFTGSGRDPPPMTIKQDVARDLLNNKIYLAAKPVDFRTQLLNDPTNLPSQKPIFEPSVNRDKLPNPYKLLPHADSNSQFNYIKPYYSIREFTPKCIINF